MFAFQNDFVSSNDKYPGLECVRRWCGGLERIQKVNEFYHRHRRAIIAGHAVILLALLVLLLTR